MGKNKKTLNDKEIYKLKSYKHTKGPWVTGCGNCDTIYGPKTIGREQIIAHCPRNNGNFDYDYKNVSANAKLIASAPVMLNLLELILNEVNKYGNLDPERDREILLKIKSLMTKIK